MCIFLRQGCDDTMVQCRRPPAPRAYSLGNNPAARRVCTRQVDRATLRTGWIPTSSSASKPSCCRISTPRTRWRDTSCAAITTRRTWCRRPTCAPSSTSAGSGGAVPRRTTAARGCSRSRAIAYRTRCAPNSRSVDVTHPVLEEQLDAYLDGELAAVDARELEAHLVQCADCARFRDGRVALRAAIAARLPALRAPGALRDRVRAALRATARSEEHTSELQSLAYLVCRLLLEKKKKPSDRLLSDAAAG